MKKFKITKVLSLALATVIAVSTFTINSFAMSDVAQAHRRDLTVEEITAISYIFNADVYAKMYTDVVDELGDDETALFAHFITFGIWEQRQCTDSFNVDVYASRNPDLQKAFGDDIVSYYVHYATVGIKETWRAIPTLANAYYARTDVYSVYDYVKGQYGPKEGAIPVQTYNYAPNLGGLIEQIKEKGTI